MKRFKFSLRPVATLRSHRELRAREEFAAAIHAFSRAEQQLAVVRGRLAQLGQAIAGGRSERFRPGEESQSLAAYTRECGNEKQGQQSVATAAAEKEKRRVSYLSAHRDLEAVKRLEQQARLKHRQATDRAEQAEYDDFANRRLHAKRSHQP
jgi:flagellar protein FliJ